MLQDPLFIGAPMVLNLHAVFLPGAGWMLTASVRHDYEQWADVRPAIYERLSTAELMDVICAEGYRQLGAT